MKSFITLFLWLIICGEALAGATSQLYTGDASTIVPGKVQLQGYYDSTFGGPQRVAGASFTFGAAKRLDARLGYGQLWNDVGPDVKLGPNVGVKWRFIGDGLRKPSMAISTLYAINNGVRGRDHKNDFGCLLIGQYRMGPQVFLANLGRVWIGDNNASDLGYFSCAAARILSKGTLVALEYSQLDRLNGPSTRPTTKQITGAWVYSPNQVLFYSLQLSHLPLAQNTRWHMTFGVSTYL